MKLRVWVQFPSIVDATQIRNESIDVEVEYVEDITDGIWAYHDNDGVLRMADTRAQSQYLFHGNQIRMIENLEFNEAEAAKDISELVTSYKPDVRQFEKLREISVIADQYQDFPTDDGLERLRRSLKQYYNGEY